MPDDLYDDGGDSSPATATAKPEGMGEDDKKDVESQTALLPKDFFGGKTPAPGDTCQIKVEKVHEDEVACSYITHDDSTDKETPTEDANPKDNEMSEMMS